MWRFYAVMPKCEFGNHAAQSSSQRTMIAFRVLVSFKRRLDCGWLLESLDAGLIAGECRLAVSIWQKCERKKPMRSTSRDSNAVQRVAIPATLIPIDLPETERNVR